VFADMTTHSIPIRATQVSVAAVLLAFGGCANMDNSPLERSSPREEVSSSVDAAAAQVAEVNGRIDVALRALDDLANHPAQDLERQFRSYREALDKLEGAANKLRAESEAMERKGREYLVSWDREIATIHDEGLRNRTAERRQDVAERIDSLHDEYINAREQLAPLLQRLNEIESAVRVDLTTAGIGTIRPAVNGAYDAASPARDALRSLADAFRQATVALAPTTQTPVR
jgi:hypothetical protein